MAPSLNNPFDFIEKDKKFKLISVDYAEKYLTINKTARNKIGLIEGLYTYNVAPSIISFGKWYELTDRYWLSEEITTKSNKWFYFKEYFFSIFNRNKKTIVLFDENAFSKIEKMKEYCKIRNIKHIVTTDHLAWHFSNEKTALAFFLAFSY